MDSNLLQVQVQSGTGDISLLLLLHIADKTVWFRDVKISALNPDPESAF